MSGSLFVYITVSLRIFPICMCVKQDKKKRKKTKKKETKQKKILEEEESKRNERETGRKMLACGDAGLANQAARVISAEGGSGVLFRCFRFIGSP